MRVVRRFRFVLLAAVVAIVGASAAAIALADTSPSSTVEQIEAHPRPEAFIASYGLKASEGKAAFTLQDGQTVSVIDSGSTRCMLHGVEAKVAGRCFTEEAVSAGEAITVGDECGSGGENRMEITGLAPEGTVGVRLNSSDGASQETTVVDGAFRFEGTNPAEDGPHPTGVEWLDGNGAASGSAALPVSGDGFCLPIS
jgi:hypothetical protein